MKLNYFKNSDAQPRQAKTKLCQQRRGLPGLPTGRLIWNIR